MKVQQFVNICIALFLYVPVSMAGSDAQSQRKWALDWDLIAEKINEKAELCFVESISKKSARLVGNTLV